MSHCCSVIKDAHSRGGGVAHLCGETEGGILHEVVREDEEKGEQRQVKKERNKEGEGGSTIFSFHLMRRL